MRTLTIVLFLFLICAAPAAAQTFPITIDATALSYIQYTIAPIASFINESSQTLSLAPGAYSFLPPQTGFVLPFTVDAAGKVDYDPAFEDILDGTGTTTLTVVGFAMTIDVSSLSYNSIALQPKPLGTSGPNNLRLLPGSHRLTPPGTGIEVRYTPP